MKHLGLGEVKRFTGGMHNTENISGMLLETNDEKSVQVISDSEDEMRIRRSIRGIQ